MFKRKKPPVEVKSIEQQAEQIRINSISKKIDAFAEKMSKIIREGMWNENFDIAVYSVVAEAIKKKTDNWFNSQINKKTMQEAIPNPNPKTLRW